MIVTAIGDKGTGKSRAVRQLVARRLEQWRTSCAVVHDPAEQWRGGSVFATVAAVRAYLKAKGSLPRLVIVRQDSPHRVCRLAWDLGNLTCVIDEFDSVCTAKRWAKDEWISQVNCGAARALAHYGRHRGVDLMGGFRFTRNVNEDIPGLADYVLIMRHSPGALYDVRALAQRFGVDYSQAATQINDHECLVWGK